MNTALPIHNIRKQLQDAFYRAHEIQHALNSQLSTDYPAQGWSFLRAAWLEAAEALEMLNWKWWKGAKFGQAPTPAQQKMLWMELVDIFHFLLAHYLTEAYQSGFSRNEVADRISGTKLLETSDALAGAFVTGHAVRRTPDPDEQPVSWVEPLAMAIEGFVRAAIAGDSATKLASNFASMCGYAELSATDLLTFYFAKQALNEFRWANGYRDGTYQKTWRGEDGKEYEDTDALLELLDKDVVLASEEGRGALLVGSTSMKARLNGLLCYHYAESAKRRSKATGT